MTKHEPETLQVQIVVRRDVAVAVPRVPIPPMSREDVEAIRRKIRAERAKRAVR